MAPGKFSPDHSVNHILCQASRKNRPATLIPPDRQMKSVNTQTQMLTQGCKVWSHSLNNTNGHTFLHPLKMHMYSCMLCKHSHFKSKTSLSIIYTAQGHLHTDKSVPHTPKKSWTQGNSHTHTHINVNRFTHTLSGSSFLMQLTPRDTEHLRIQGPCLPTLVIMVNSWACYSIAMAYGCCIALQCYKKRLASACSDTL